MSQICENCDRPTMRNVAPRGEMPVMECSDCTSYPERQKNKTDARFGNVFALFQEPKNIEKKTDQLKAA